MTLGSLYYALTPTSSYEYPVLDLSLYKAYFRRLHKHLTGVRAPANITNPIPIFKEVLLSIRNRTEEVLGSKMNSSNRYFSEDCAIYTYISAPWELNHTYSYAMHHAMEDLSMRIQYGEYKVPVMPWTEWQDHTNDEKDYSCENGTAITFEQARKSVEMMEYECQNWRQCWTTWPWKWETQWKYW